MRIDEKDKINVEKTGYKYIFTYDRYDKLLTSNRIIGIDIDKKRNTTRYLRVKCPYCKIEYDVQYRNLIKKGQMCSNCCNKYENSFAYYIEQELNLKLEDIWDFELNTVNPYYIHKNFNQHKIWFKCKKHGSYEQQIINFNHKGKSCPYCNGRKFHPTDSFDAWLKKKYGTNALEKYWDYDKNTIDPTEIYYKNNYDKIWIKCQEKDYHGSYETTPYNFYKGHKCSYCHPCGKNAIIHLYDSFGYNHFDKICMNWSQRNKTSPFKISCKTGDKYWFICDNCNKEFEKQIYNTTNRNEWCPYCSMSKGEKKIEEWLKFNNVNYIYDKEYFSDLFGINGGLLRPDFILPDYKIWIEYDGEFHFKEIYGELERNATHDERKNKYAKKNGWKLIRIPYWDFENIEAILDEVLKNV